MIAFAAGILLLLVLPSSTTAFLFGGTSSDLPLPFVGAPPPAVSGLEDLTQQCGGKDLNLRLVLQPDPEYHQQQALLVLDQLSVSLSPALPPTSNAVPLPGAVGNPSVSSGPRALRVTKPPTFVGMNGMEQVSLERTCWELAWRNGDVAGNLICGFYVPNEIVRNSDAVSLDAGTRLYVSFLVWTEDMLQAHHEQMMESKEKATTFRKERQDALSAMAEPDSTPWAKAAHYRQALDAHEKYLLYDKDYRHRWEVTPPEDDLITLDQDHGVMLLSKGTIWRKDDNFFGDDHVFVGEAILRGTRTSSE